MKYHQKGGDDPWAGFLCCKMTHTRSNPLFQDNRHYVLGFAWHFQVFRPDHGTPMIYHIHSTWWLKTPSFPTDITITYSFLLPIFVPGSDSPKKHDQYGILPVFARWIPQIFPPQQGDDPLRRTCPDGHVGPRRGPRARWCRLSDADDLWSWKRKSWDSIQSGKPWIMDDHGYFMTFYWIFSVSHNFFTTQICLQCQWRVPRPSARLRAVPGTTGRGPTCGAGDFLGTHSDGIPRMVNWARALPVYCNTFHHGDWGKWLESRLETQGIDTIWFCGWLTPVSNFHCQFVETPATHLVGGLNPKIGGHQKILLTLYPPVVGKWIKSHHESTAGG